MRSQMNGYGGMNHTKVEWIEECCPECLLNGKKVKGSLPARSGNLICEKCGFVIRENRLEEEVHLQDPSVPLIINKHSNKGSHLSTSSLKGKLSHGSLAAFKRMNKLQNSNRKNLDQKRFDEVSREISRITGEMRTGRNVVHTAKLIACKAVRMKLVKPKNILVTGGACVYAASRMRRITRSLEEVAKSAGVDPVNLGRMYRLLVERMSLKISPPEVKHFVSALGEKLSLSFEVQFIATNFLDAAKQMGVTGGKSPRTLAASALYIAAKLKMEEKTVTEVASAANIANSTLRNNVPVLAKTLKLDVRILDRV